MNDILYLAECMLFTILFDTFYTVHLHSAPVYSSDPVIRDLPPCPLNTSPVKVKHRRVV